MIRRWQVELPDKSLVVEDLAKRRWLEVVDSTRLVPSSTRALLRAYADRMTADGEVWEERKQLAARLEVTERTVQRAFKAARRAGLLRYVAGGFNGSATEHQASVPVAGAPDRDRLPLSPCPTWETRRETARETETNSLRVSLPAARRETPVVSPREEECDQRERVAVDRGAADEPTTTTPAPAVSLRSPNSSNKKGSGCSPPLAAPVPIRSSHVCRQGCHGFDLLTSLYAREAA